MATVKAIVFVKHYRDHAPGDALTGAAMDKFLLSNAPKDAYHSVAMPVPDDQAALPLNPVKE